MGKTYLTWSSMIKFISLDYNWPSISSYQVRPKSVHRYQCTRNCLNFEPSTIDKTFQHLAWFHQDTTLMEYFFNSNSEIGTFEIYWDSFCRINLKGKVSSLQGNDRQPEIDILTSHVEINIIKVILMIYFKTVYGHSPSYQKSRDSVEEKNYSDFLNFQNCYSHSIPT